MSIAFRTVCSAALLLAGISSAVRPGLAASADGDKKADIKPDVAALLKQSTDVYKKMKAYKADVILKTEGALTGGEAVNRESKFVLALDRPNKFCYRAMTTENTAAVSDGKTFFNYRGDKLNQYQKLPAPADYKGINIVDDVTFEPLGTYLIALMLQGDALADKDVKQGVLKSTLGPIVTENGKKWQILHMLFGPQEETYDFYFGVDDHLLNKTVLKLTLDQGKITQTETLENVKIDKPVEASVFDYTPPANAHKVDKFTAPQRPDDARNNTCRPGQARLATYRAW